LRYAFIEEHRDSYPVRRLCALLDVSASGFYAWRERPPSPARQRREQLQQEIRAIHARVKGRYGSPRVHAELVASGSPCCVNTVAQLMRSLGIRAISSKRFRVSTTDSKHDRPVARNRLDQDFRASGLNEVWLADITYIGTQQGWLYLAAVEDLCSRMVVGWSMATSLESRLVVDALAMAVGRRFPEEGLIAHSDRGSQYASEHYQSILSKHGIECSRSRSGNCYDNAPMESFFAALKKELVHHERYLTFEAAKASLFEYIEVFYNRQRRHSSLDYRSPAEFEASEFS
jgi:putative transposase